MKKALLLVALFLASLGSPVLSLAQADESSGMSVLHTTVNPANNNTYHLLTASSWEDAASYARSLGGFLVTVDDEAENTWLFDTFAGWDNQSRHLWIGLSDANEEGEYRWHDGTPFLYREWGAAQPSEGGDEDYVHIASTNMGNIDPGTWNDLEDDPQYFPVYGVVEIGPGADFALRFDGSGDHVVVPHDAGLDFTNMTHMEISAWIQPHHLEGHQFIVMKGDYGWGLYLQDDHLAFSSEYSMARHPVSNGTVEADVWSHVQVNVVVGVGYTFHLNGVEIGVVLDDDANIPLGDFGSNDCFQSGDDCDELYFSRMGAGCDCGYFEGLLDNVTVRAGEDASEHSVHMQWMFSEGEGDTTSDEDGERNGEIDGADWVMPDGSIVAQAVELFVGEGHEVEFAGAGDTLLFFVEIEEYTRTLYWNSYSLKFDDFNEMTEYTVYAQHGSVPDEWNHDTATIGEWGFVFESWSWPDVGVMWFTMILETDVEDLFIELDADMADPPPSLEDMTELRESIPVTNQNLEGGRPANGDVNALYYYVNVTEPLADLRVRTYGGQGNLDLGISYYSPPTPTGWWGGWDDGGEAVGEEKGETEVLMEAWSTNMGNDEEVHLFDVEPGLYYITAYSFRNAREYTIVADFVYPPENVEPEDAITLTPGVEYGLLSGYRGLSQYFKVDVPQGTERLIVDLNDGAGQADLYMRLDQAPTSSTYTHHSSAEGANDRIAFNDPTPGWWYILLTSESAFTGVNIVAEFADRYVWEYDGTPIELYNDEPVDGIGVTEGGEIFFFAELDEPGNMLRIETYGGSGDIMLQVEGLQFELDFFEGGRPGREMEASTEPFDIYSGKDGTNHLMTIEFPMNGRVDIVLTGLSDAEEISLVARWDESDFPIEPIEPSDPIEPGSAPTCAEEATMMFEDLDVNGDGTVDQIEIKTVDGEEIDFKSMDINADGAYEYREFLQTACTCDTELWLVFEAFAQGRWEVSTEILETHDWSNDYDFPSVDADRNDAISEEELEMLALLCVTTFDAFDGDGDGVPDEKDAFPDDPTESKDTDGDGVGDNSDIVASVSNDIIYASAGLVFIVLAGFMLTFLRNNGGRASEIEGKVWDDEDRLNEHLMGDVAPRSEAPYSSESMIPDNGLADSLLQSTSVHQTEAPSHELMGMMLDGVETIEHPSGSNIIWTRSSPDDAWIPKN